jgi:serine/threonine protein phosphatase 1
MAISIEADHIPGMLAKLFRGKAPVAVRAPQVDPGARVYAVGDVHGRLDLLCALNQMIHEDAYAHQAPRNVVVYLGDYIDRGAHSREVLDTLIESPLPGFEHVHLLGNHEDSLLRFMEDASVGPAWLAYGGGATLMSYGIRMPASERDLFRVQEDLHRHLPESHLRFLRSCAYTHSEGDYFFVHAGVKPGVPLEAQVPDSLLWIRDEFLDSHAANAVLTFLAFCAVALSALTGGGERE